MPAGCDRRTNAISHFHADASANANLDTDNSRKPTTNSHDDHSTNSDRYTRWSDACAYACWTNPLASANPNGRRRHGHTHANRHYPERSKL
jgi:hypothetical protein